MFTYILNMDEYWLTSSMPQQMFKLQILLNYAVYVQQRLKFQILLNYAVYAQQRFKFQILLNYAVIPENAISEE